MKTILAKVASQGNQIQAVKRQQHKYKSDTSKVTTAQQIYNNDITTKLAAATSDVASISSDVSQLTTEQSGISTKLNTVISDMSKITVPKKSSDKVFLGDCIFNANIFSH